MVRKTVIQQVFGRRVCGVRLQDRKTILMGRRTRRYSFETLVHKLAHLRTIDEKIDHGRSGSMSSMRWRGLLSALNYKEIFDRTGTDKPEKISRHRRKKRIVLKNSFGIVGLRCSTDSQAEGQDDAGEG